VDLVCKCLRHQVAFPLARHFPRYSFIIYSYLIHFLQLGVRGNSCSIFYSEIVPCCMLFTARATQSAVMPQYVVCRPSVTFRYRDHIGWNSSKIISRLISLRIMLGMASIQMILCNGSTPNLGWNWVLSRAQKPAISLKRCKI